MKSSSVICILVLLFGFVSAVPKPDFDFRVFDLCDNNPFCLRQGQKCAHAFDEAFDDLDDDLRDDDDWDNRACLSRLNLDQEFLEFAGGSVFRSHGRFRSYLDSLDQSAPQSATDLRCCMMENKGLAINGRFNVNYFKNEVTDELDDSDEYRIIPTALAAVDSCGEPVDCKFEEYKACLVKTCVGSLKTSPLV